MVTVSVKQTHARVTQAGQATTVQHHSAKIPRATITGSARHWADASASLVGLVTRACSIRVLAIVLPLHRKASARILTASQLAANVLRAGLAMTATQVSNTWNES